MWNNNQNGYQDNMRKQATAKMPTEVNKINSMAAQVAMNRTTGTTPKIGGNSYQFDKAQGRAKNDMSAVDDFKQAFRQARQGGDETFFWKKTKDNPSGMFSTEYAEQGSQNSKQPTSPKQGMDQLMFEAIKHLPQQQSALEKQLMQPVSYPFVMDDIARDAKIIAMKNIIPNPKGNPGMYVNGNTSKYANGGTVQQGNIEQQVTQLVQAAASGDQEATQQIEQIMQAAQQGDQQALQIAQIIQKVIETMKQQSGVKAKLGAKLDYIRKIKGLCPEGTEKVYLRDGGCMCKKPKSEKGGEMPKKMNEIQKFKAAKGCKTKK